MRWLPPRARRAFSRRPLEQAAQFGLDSSREDELRLRAFDRESGSFAIARQGAEACVSVHTNRVTSMLDWFTRQSARERFR